MIEVGLKAPDFTLVDQDNKKVSLSDFLGKKVILYFYPKDNTPGCSAQAATFSKEIKNFEDQNSVILGISKDSQNSHFNFANKLNLPFKILSDENLEVIKAYGVWQEKSLYGRKYFGVSRTTYLIDEQGVIVKVFTNVKAKQNPYDILEYLQK